MRPTSLPFACACPLGRDQAFPIAFLARPQLLTRSAPLPVGRDIVHKHGHDSLDVGGEFRHAKEDDMKRTLTVLGVAAAFAVTCTIGFAQGQQQQGKEKALIFVSADKATFKDTIPGVSQAALWGDSDKGPYGAFTKFVPGFDAGTHTHTNDVWLVVLTGAYLYKDEAGEKRVGPGDFIWIPGKHKHWSGGDAKEGALFYVESSGKFDLVPAK
jgi:mannose-6-phosphate isomerase-like protein (cupin superfamily)